MHSADLVYAPLVVGEIVAGAAQTDLYDAATVQTPVLHRPAEGRAVRDARAVHAVRRIRVRVHVDQTHRSVLLLNVQKKVVLSLWCLVFRLDVD